MTEILETSIADLRAGLESGQITAVEIVEACIARIEDFDGPDTRTSLNSVVVRNYDALAEAVASDVRRANGQVMGPLDGIPYTAKDSYLVRGMTAASGSPAFLNLLAQRDAFTVKRLREGERSAWARPTCRRWQTGACSAVSMAGPRAPTTPIS